MSSALVFKTYRRVQFPKPPNFLGFGLYNVQTCAVFKTTHSCSLGDEACGDGFKVCFAAVHDALGGRRGGLFRRIGGFQAKPPLWRQRRHDRRATCDTGASFASRLAVLNAARWVVCPVIWTPVTLSVIACAAARGTKLVAYDRPLKAHARRVERSVTFVTQEDKALVVTPAAKYAVSCVGHVSVTVAKRVRGVCAQVARGLRG